MFRGGTAEATNESHKCFRNWVFNFDSDWIGGRSEFDLRLATIGWIIGSLGAIVVIPITFGYLRESLPERRRISNDIENDYVEVYEITSNDCIAARIGERRGVIYCLEGNQLVLMRGDIVDRSLIRQRNPAAQCTVVIAASSKRILKIAWQSEPLTNLKCISLEEFMIPTEDEFVRFSGTAANVEDDLSNIKRGS